jgi:glycosyltransferase involved in cell wall biosynthesis
VHAADACWIPFCCDDLTRYIYPLKLNEYLAAGKPVLATPFASFGDLTRHVYQYRNLEEFDAALRRSLQNQGLANHWMRLQSAMPHTWANRAKRFAAVIEEVLSAKLMPMYASQK